MKSSSRPRSGSNCPRNRESIWIYFIIFIQSIIILVLHRIGETSGGSAESFDQTPRLLTCECQGTLFPTRYPVPLAIRNLTLLYTERNVQSSQRMRKHLEAFKEFMAWPGRESPQMQQDMGVLIVVGGEDTCSDAVVTARAIRDGVGSSLPIAIAYYGARGCSPASLEYLENALSTLSDICLMDLSMIEHPLNQRPLNMIHPKLSFGSEEWLEAFPKGLIRLMALYHAPYSRVLLLNAGVIPLRDPIKLFDSYSSSSLSRNNILIWRRWDAEIDGEQIATVQGMLGMEGGILPCSIDARHMMIYKTENWDWIEWTLFLYSYPEYFDQVVGDEAIMHLGFSMVNATGLPKRIKCSTSLPSMLLSNLSSPSQRTVPTWGPVAVIQSHPSDGIPLFLHAWNDREAFLRALTDSCHWYTTGPIDIDTVAIITDALEMIEKRKRKAIVAAVMDGTSDIENKLHMIESQVWWDHVFDGNQRAARSIPLEDMIHVQTAVINARRSLPFVIE